MWVQCFCPIKSNKKRRGLNIPSHTPLDKLEIIQQGQIYSDASTTGAGAAALATRAATRSMSRWPALVTTRPLKSDFFTSFTLSSDWRHWKREVRLGNALGASTNLSDNVTIGDAEVAGSEAVVL